MNSSRRTGLLLGLASVILILAAWAHGRRGADVQVEVSSARRDLAKEVGPVRPSEGRLTGGFAYSPYVPGGGGPLKNPQRLGKIRERIEMSMRQNGSPQAFADAGVLNLLGGQHDKAVAFLEKASERSPADAGIWSDLAAAYLTRSDKGGKFADLLDALEAADRAAKTAPDLSEARFNFALTLDRLVLISRARAAWPQFVDQEGNSAWSQEAKVRFAALFRPGLTELWQKSRITFEESSTPLEAARELVNLSRQQARELAEEELFGRWAKARSESREADAARALALLQGLGTALAEVHGDLMVADAVQALDSIEAAPILQDLISGHSRYQDGLRLYSVGSYEAAAKLFSQASEALSRPASPFELWARFQEALCEYQNYRYESALSRLAGILEDRRSERYPALRARALWVTGLTEGILGAPAESFSAYRKSREIFGSIGELGNQAALSNLLAEAHKNLEDLSGAWKFHGLAMQGLPWVTSSVRRQLILEKLADSLLVADRPQLTIYFQEESLRKESGATVPAGVVPGLLRIAEAQHQQGNGRNARAFLHLAEEEISHVTEKSMREALQGDLLAWEGKAELDTNPEGAIRLLTAAIASYERSHYRQQLVDLHLQKSRALRRQRRYALAEEDLRLAIELIDGYRTEGDINSTSFGAVREVFDEMVLLQVFQDRPGRAFEYAEQGRAKILALSSTNEIPEVPSLTLAEIQEELPPEAAMMVFWIGERDLFIWVVRSGGFAFRSMPLDVKRLDRMVLKFRKAVSMDDLPSADRLGKQLYEALLEPLQQEIADAGTLVLVPDQVLQAVPFATLRNVSGYLIEAHALSVSPSASLYVRCLRHQQDFAGVEPNVLAFGDPAFDHSLFPGLQRLSHSQEEARQIVELYPKGRLVLGGQATKARLLNEMGKWQVIHFGGHAVSNPENPFLSALLLAPEAEDSGVFYVRDLAGARLRRVRLMFLAACSTLLGDSPESGPSIAAPLLAQGVPSVVGTLWGVSDRRSERFAFEFHHRFVESRNAASALREAQLAFLGSSMAEERKMSLWGAFELLGT
jgi:CHAT domain-containing protein